MSQPALTIASLLTDPRLERACRTWLKGGRYDLEDLGSLTDPVAELERRREAFDVVLLQQGTITPEVYEGLRRQGLLLPAVVVGEVSGRQEYHEAEVHLPQDQLEQIAYSVDAAVSRFLRQGGVEPVVHIPDRIFEGYGPNVGAIRALAAKNGFASTCAQSSKGIAFGPSWTRWPQIGRAHV